MERQQDALQMKQWRFALLDQNPRLAQRPMAVAEKRFGEQPLEKRFGEQPLGRPNRVGAIDDDHVVTPRRGVFDPRQAVLEMQLRARIGVGLAQFGKIAFGGLGDFPVDVHLNGAFDVGVAQYFPQGAAVAAADDQHPAGVRMGEQRRMRHHLVV